MSAGLFPMQTFHLYLEKCLIATAYNIGKEFVMSSQVWEEE